MRKQRHGQVQQPARGLAGAFLLCWSCVETSSRVTLAHAPAIFAANTTGHPAQLRWLPGPCLPDSMLFFLPTYQGEGWNVGADT